MSSHLSTLLKSDWQGAKLALSAETANAYLTFLRLNEERRIVAELESASADIAKTLSQRAAAGVASDVEVGRQEAETESLRRAVLEIDRQRAAAAVRLDRLRGQQAGDGKPPSGELTRQIRPPKLPSSIAAGAVSARPDLAAVASTVHAAYAREEAARLDLYPRLSLALDGGVSAGDLTGPTRLRPPRGRALGKRLDDDAPEPRRRPRLSSGSLGRPTPLPRRPPRGVGAVSPSACGSRCAHQGNRRLSPISSNSSRAISTAAARSSANRTLVNTRRPPGAAGGRSAERDLAVAVDASPNRASPIKMRRTPAIKVATASPA